MYYSEQVTIMRTKYEYLLCYAYDYPHPTGTNGALANVYDYFVFATEKDADGHYRDKERAFETISEIGSFIYHALNHIVDNITLDEKTLSVIMACLYRLQKPSPETIPSVIEAAGLALGLFEI